MRLASVLVNSESQLLPSECWASSNSLRAWTEQKAKEEGTQMISLWILQYISKTMPILLELETERNRNKKEHFKK